MKNATLKVPEGWKLVRLGEVANIKNGKCPYFDDDGLYPVYGSNGLIGYSNRYLINGYFVLVGRVGASGEVNFVKGKVWVSDNSLILFNDNSKIYPLFLYKLLLYISPKRFISQTAQPLITQSLIQEISIPLPSLPEQQKIAEILETVDNCIEKTQQLIEKYKRIKMGLMEELLTKGIDENGNIRSEETHRFKDSPLGRIPEEWEVVRLGDIAFVTKLAGFEYTKYFDYSIDGEIFLVRVINLKNGKIEFKDMYTMPKKISDKLKRSKLWENDIVFSYVGTIGECAIIPMNDKFHLAPNVAKISLNLEKAISKFYVHYLMSDFGKKEINFIISSTTQNALSMSNIRKIKIPLPPLSEQQRIAEILSQIDEVIEKEEKYKEKLERLKKGLMEDLLSGKIRVNNLIEEKE